MQKQNKKMSWHPSQNMSSLLSGTICIIASRWEAETSFDQATNCNIAEHRTQEVPLLQSHVVKRNTDRQLPYHPLGNGDGWPVSFLSTFLQTRASNRALLCLGLELLQCLLVKKPWKQIRILHPSRMEQDTKYKNWPLNSHFFLVFLLLQICKIRLHRKHTEIMSSREIDCGLIIEDAQMASTTNCSLTTPRKKGKGLLIILTTRPFSKSDLPFSPHLFLICVRQHLKWSWDSAVLNLTTIQTCTTIASISTPLYHDIYSEIRDATALGSVIEANNRYMDNKKTINVSEEVPTSVWNTGSQCCSTAERKKRD